MPLYNSYHQPGLLPLTARGDGTASGRLSWPLSFMGTRTERIPRVAPASIVGDPDVIGETDLHPRLWAAERDAAMAVGQRLGDGVRQQWQRKTTPGQGTMWLLDPNPVVGVGQGRGGTAVSGAARRPPPSVRRDHRRLPVVARRRTAGRHRVDGHSRPGRPTPDTAELRSPRRSGFSGWCGGAYCCCPRQAGFHSQGQTQGSYERATPGATRCRPGQRRVPGGRPPGRAAMCSYPQSSLVEPAATPGVDESTTPRPAYT